jgi:hypothetical protein
VVSRPDEHDSWTLQQGVQGPDQMKIMYTSAEVQDPKHTNAIYVYSSGVYRAQTTTLYAPAECTGPRLRHYMLQRGVKGPGGVRYYIWQIIAEIGMWGGGRIS